MGKKRKKQGSTDAMASVLMETPEPARSQEATPEPPAPVVVAALPFARSPSQMPPPPEALTEEKAAEVLAAQPDPEPEALVDQDIEVLSVSVPPPSQASSEAAPSTARPKKRKKKRATRPPPAMRPAGRDALDQKIDRLEAKLEEKKGEAAKAAREGFGSVAPDDQSVPPVDLEVHDEFFAAGEKPHAIARDPSGAFSAVDARHAQKMTAAAHARRAHLSRYVKWAVGAAAGILLLGITVSKLRHPDNEIARHEVTHVAAALPQPQEVQQPVGKVDPPPVVELADQGNLDDKKVDDTKVDDKKDEIKDDTDKKPDDLPPEKPKNAWQEKQTAKAALERGANGVAISAGERSVALDSSDGEAWLVLGAAYQATSNPSQAKRCFNACVTQGKKGPIGDCRDMLNAL